MVPKAVSRHIRIYLYMKQHSQHVCMVPQHGTGCVKDNSSVAYIPFQTTQLECVLVYVRMCVLCVCVCPHVTVSLSAEHATSQSEERVSHVGVPTSNASFGTRERHHFGMCRSMW